MNEATLKSALMKLLRATEPSWVAQRHEDTLTAGIPDLSITGNHWTTWWEIKYANPKFKSLGIQELTCKRLARQSHCEYIVYDECDGDRCVRIFHPDLLKNWETAPLTTIGFNHQNVVEYIRDRQNNVSR